MRGNDLVFAFPSLLLAVLLSTALGPGATNAILAVGVFNILVFARLTRGAALPLWQREFTLAARVAGKGAWRISIEHVLPNLGGLLLVQLEHPACAWAAGRDGALLPGPGHAAAAIEPGAACWPTPRR